MVSRMEVHVCPRVPVSPLSQMPTILHICFMRFFQYQYLQNSNKLPYGIHPVAVGMLVHDVFISPVHHGLSVRYIAEAFHDAFDVGVVMLEGYIMLIRLENIVEPSFEHDLTGLCAGSIKMA